MVKLSANFGIIKGEIGKIKSPHTYNSPQSPPCNLFKHSPELCRSFQNVKQVIPSSKSVARPTFTLKLLVDVLNDNMLSVRLLLTMAYFGGRSIDFRCRKLLFRPFRTMQAFRKL